MYEEIETCEFIAKNWRSTRLENSWNFSKKSFELLENYISDFSESEICSFIYDLEDKKNIFFDFWEKEDPKFFYNII